MQFFLKYIFILGVSLFTCPLFSQNNFRVELINTYADNALMIRQSNYSESKIKKDLAAFYQIDTNDVIVGIENENPQTLYQMGDFTIAINENGNIIAKNMSNNKAKWVDLKFNIEKEKLSQNTYFIVKEESEGLVIKYKEWIINDPKKTSKKTSKTIVTIIIPYDDIYYHADGKLSPSEISMYAENIKFIPENRKILYEFQILIPKELYNAVPVMIELCTPEGFQLRMIGRVNKEIMEILRDNLAPNTYMLKFYNGDSKEEIKRVLIHMLPIKEDHGIGTD